MCAMDGTKTGDLDHPTFSGSGSSSAPGRFARVIGAGGGASLVVATGWYGLAERGVTVPSQPDVYPSQSIRERLQVYFHWFDSTLAQERMYTSLAIAAFVCLAWLALRLRLSFGLPAMRSGASGLAGGLVACGSGLWVVGNVIQLGGHHAVGMMATHGNPLETVGSIGYGVDTIDDAFELAATAALGAGMLIFAAVAIRASQAGWGRLSLVVGVALIATSYSYAIENGDLTNVLLLLCGIGLLPTWMIWSGLLGGASRRSMAHGSPSRDFPIEST